MPTGPGIPQLLRYTHDSAVRTIGGAPCSRVQPWTVELCRVLVAQDWSGGG